MRGLFANVIYKYWKRNNNALFIRKLIQSLKERKYQTVIKEAIRQAREPSGKSAKIQSNLGKKIYKYRSLKIYREYFKGLIKEFSRRSPIRKDTFKAEITYIFSKIQLFVSHTKLKYNRDTLFFKFAWARITSNNAYVKSRDFVLQNKLPNYAEFSNKKKRQQSWFIFNNIDIKSSLQNIILKKREISIFPYQLPGELNELFPKNKILGFSFVNNKLLILREAMPDTKSLATFESLLKFYEKQNIVEINSQERPKFLKIKPLLYAIDLNSSTYINLIGYYNWRPVYQTKYICNIKYLRYLNKNFIESFVKLLKYLISKITEFYKYLILGFNALPYSDKIINFINNINYTPNQGKYKIKLIVEAKAFLKAKLHAKTYLEKKWGFYISITKKIKNIIHKIIFFVVYIIKSIFKFITFCIRLIFRIIWWLFIQILISPIKVPYLIIKYACKFIYFVINISAIIIIRYKLNYLFNALTYKPLFFLIKAIFQNIIFCKTVFLLYYEYIKNKVWKDILIQKITKLKVKKRDLTLLKGIIIALTILVLFIDMFYTNILFTNNMDFSSFVYLYIIVYWSILLLTTYRHEIIYHTTYSLAIIGYCMYRDINRAAIERDYANAVVIEGIPHYYNEFYFNTINFFLNNKILISIFFIILIYIIIMPEKESNSLINTYADNINLNTEFIKYDRTPKITDIFFDNWDFKIQKEYERWLELSKPGFFFEAVRRAEPYFDQMFNKFEGVIEAEREDEIEKYNAAFDKHDAEKREEVYRFKAAEEAGLPYFKKKPILQLYKMKNAPFDEIIFEDYDDHMAEDYYEETSDEIVALNLYHYTIENRVKTLFQKQKSFIDKYRIIFDDWTYMETDKFEYICSADDLEDLEYTNIQSNIPNSLLDSKIHAQVMFNIANRIDLKYKSTKKSINLITRPDSSINNPLYSAVVIKYLFKPLINRELDAIVDGLVLKEDAKVFPTLIDYFLDGEIRKKKIQYPIINTDSSVNKTCTLIRPTFLLNEDRKLKKLHFDVLDTVEVLLEHVYNKQISIKDAQSFFKTNREIFLDFLECTLFYQRYLNIYRQMLHPNEMIGPLKTDFFTKIRLYIKKYKQLSEK